MNAVSLAEVLVRPDVWRGAAATAGVPVVHSGFAPLDAELPGGGWARGGVSELLCAGPGIGECSLLLPALASVQAEGRWVVLVAPPQVVYAPAWGDRLDLARLLVVSPETYRDRVWAAEQSLSSGAPGAVLCWAPRIESAAVRRLQVAAATGGALAFLFRPESAGREASAAPLRLQLGATPEGRLAVRLLKRRGPPCAETLLLEMPQRLTRDIPHESADLAGAAPAGAGARGLALVSVT